MNQVIVWAVSSIAATYVGTWLILVPNVNSKLMYVPEDCLAVPDKIYTPKPSGLALLSPYISYHSEVDMHIYIEHPYKSEHNLSTRVFLILPFYAVYEYQFESEGFRCGGKGRAYLWFNGINIKEKYFFIT